MPEFEARGFVWYPDYAGGDSQAVPQNTIPLQRRQGREWPTVELDFTKYERPWFGLHFALLPETCYYWDYSTDEFEPILREQATVGCGPACFMLCRGETQGLDGQFGSSHWLSPRPYRRLDADLDKLVALLPFLFELFDGGIPEPWLVSPIDYVHKHVRLTSSWEDTRERSLAVKRLIHPKPKSMWAKPGRRQLEMGTTDHKKRFVDWRKTLPLRTSYLVEGVLNRVVPEFETRGFVWYPDYAGGSPNSIASNTIPLQRRQGRVWPTVQLHFAERNRPRFSLHFAELPETCHGMGRLGSEPLPREEASIGCGPACFMLCKGKSTKRDGEFGSYWFSPWPRRRLDADLDEVVGLLPILFELFDRGIPEPWSASSPGHVHKHVRLEFSWTNFEKKRRVAREQIQSFVGGASGSAKKFSRRFEEEMRRIDNRSTVRLLLSLFFLVLLLFLFFGNSVPFLIIILTFAAIFMFHLWAGARSERRVAVSCGLQCPLCDEIPRGDAVLQTIGMAQCERCRTPLEIG